MQRAALAAIGAAVVIGGVVWLGSDRPDEAPIAEYPDPAPIDSAPSAIAPIAPALPAGPAPGDADPLADYRRLLDAQSEIEDFVQNGERLAASVRDARAQELTALIDRLEEQRVVVGAQGLYLRAAIAQAQFAGDRTARDEAVAALQTRYAGAAPSTSHLDARYRSLKSREQEIVRDANTRKFFPNGMTREEFLRAELDAAVKEAYAAKDE